MMYSAQAADSERVRLLSCMTGAWPSGFRSLMDCGEKMGSRWCRVSEYGIFSSSQSQGSRSDCEFWRWWIFRDILCGEVGERQWDLRAILGDADSCIRLFAVKVLLLYL